MSNIFCYADIRVQDLESMILFFKSKSYSGLYKLRKKETRAMAEAIATTQINAKKLFASFCFHHRRAAL